MAATPSKATCIAMIPARAGSKRAPGKNTRELGGHPLLAYTVAAALESGVFDSVLVSTDSPDTAAIASHYGAEIPSLRPAALASDLSPDIEWIEYTLDLLEGQGRSYDAFSILRPTSPFRMPETIRKAWSLFLNAEGADSLRAVEKCSEHPGKMWVIRGGQQKRMFPLLPFGPKEQPWHSTPYQALPEVFVQNASLEIAWTRIVREGRTIAGETIVPLVSEGYEGYDINRPEDFRLAEELVADGKVTLPPVRCVAYSAREQRA